MSTREVLNAHYRAEKKRVMNKEPLV